MMNKTLGLNHWYIYIYIYRDIDRERERERETDWADCFSSKIPESFNDKYVKELKGITTTSRIKVTDSLELEPHHQMRFICMSLTL